MVHQMIHRKFTIHREAIADSDGGALNSAQIHMLKSEPQGKKRRH
jgi:hypothetical protein